jgi:hypothetical protein
MPAVSFRGLEEVALRALPLGIMIDGMAGQAERSSRGESCHRRRLMALVTPRVGVHRSSMGFDDVRILVT